MSPAMKAVNRLCAGGPVSCKFYHEWDINFGKEKDFTYTSSMHLLNKLDFDSNFAKETPEEKKRKCEEIPQRNSEFFAKNYNRRTCIGG